jgi:hypothetical protein
MANNRSKAYESESRDPRMEYGTAEISETKLRSRGIEDFNSR